ncbi:MAG: hypothetical protein J6K98_04040 [Clostridia bacterium]|nr:hypothetical protein [Clostridia bacterium]
MTLPEGFACRMQTLLGKEYPAFIAGYDRPAERGLRVNTAKLSVADFTARFPYALTPTPFSPVGFTLEGELKAGADPWHHAGAFYMQEPSAMSAVTVLSPRPGERILDLCAAPGGKSTQIAAMQQGQGLLWSNEYVRARASALVQNLERCGVAHSVVSNMDTAPLCEKLAGQFDAVLADVPCSGEGMFRKEEAALTMWSEENITLCAQRGAHILNAAAKAVRPGGRLMYSTCTFAPEENECQIARFLLTHPDFSLHPITVSWGHPACSWAQVAPFAPDIDGSALPLSHARRIFPADGGEGHFIALLVRDGEGAVPAGLRADGKPDKNSAACEALLADCFTEVPAGRFVTVGDTVRLLPNDLPDTRGLYLVAAGVTAATVCRDRLEPCHGIFLSRRPEQCRQVLHFTRDDTRTAAFLRGETVDAPGLSGWTAVAVDGVIAGFGKVSGGVLKNRYPKALRLRG